MSSSNRGVSACDGVIYRQERPIGPMRLPANRPEDFVHHFNRTYHSIGIRLTANPDDGQDPGPESKAEGSLEGPESKT